MYYNIIILWDLSRICGPSLTETSLAVHDCILQHTPEHIKTFHLGTRLKIPSLCKSGSCNRNHSGRTISTSSYCGIVTSSVLLHRPNQIVCLAVIFQHGNTTAHSTHWTRWKLLHHPPQAYIWAAEPAVGRWPLSRY